VQSKYDKVLFLDIDGVLHSLDSAEMFRKDCMERLKQIVDATGCQLVLSSSWRTHEELRSRVNENLRRSAAMPMAPPWPHTACSRYGLPKVIDHTRFTESDWGDMGGHQREHERHEDILHWVSTHEVAQWIAIDDLPMHQLDKDGVHLVETCPDRGLSDGNVTRAIELLNAHAVSSSSPSASTLTLDCIDLSSGVEMSKTASDLNSSAA